LTLTASAATAAETNAAGGCNTSGRQTIKGLVVEKPVHIPVKPPSAEEEMMPLAGAGAAGGPGGRADTVKSTPAVYIGDGKYLPDSSKTDAVSAGKVGDAFASSLKISGKEVETGGVSVKGMGSNYILTDANIDLHGDGGFAMGGPKSGALVSDYGILTIRDSTITTSGQSRNATAAQDHSILKVYNSTLTSHGIPFTPDITNSGQKIQLEIDGNSRTHVTMGNSYSYFYYSTIIADGWAALSTDDADGFVYLEANHCKVHTIKSGYGTYADRYCHNVMNHCDFDVASMAAIVEAEADVTFSDTNAKCGSYFALLHSVSTPAGLNTLKVTGGDIKTKSAAVLVKSANAEIVFDGAKVVSESNVLLKSAKSVDPNAAKAANTKGQEVYGIHATFKNMDIVGDVIHADKENRRMTVYLESTTLKGAIKDASIKMSGLSKWIATADSNVTIVGDVELSQIDAPVGVTITAVAGQSGTYKLASCGTLVLKAL
jgi:hypothetical protein